MHAVSACLHNVQSGSLGISYAALDLLSLDLDSPVLLQRPKLEPDLWKPGWGLQLPVREAMRRAQTYEVPIPRQDSLNEPLIERQHSEPLDSIGKN